MINKLKELNIKNKKPQQQQQPHTEEKKVKKIVKKKVHVKKSQHDPIEEQ